MSYIRSFISITVHFRFGVAVCFASLCFLLGAPHVDAYFNSMRSFEDNSVTAAVLDITLSKNTASGTITPTQPFLFDTVLVKKAESISPQYSVYATGTAGTLCTKLSLTGAGGGATTTAPLAGFISATSSALGAWSFHLATTTSITAGETCTFALSWFAQSSETPPSAIGFSDTEHMIVSVTAMDDALPLGVVLNEILPNPEDGAAGVLGKEFIELYNNGTTAVDVLGWKVSEMSGSSEAIYTIATTTSSNRVASPGGSTIVPAHGFLVLVFHSDNKINNDGDTIRLYDTAMIKIDEYGFTTDSDNDADTDSNATPGSGNTGGGPEVVAQEGKSHARIPDGTGAWVDPVPTPGAVNVLSEGEMAVMVTLVGEARENEDQNQAQEQNQAYEGDSGEDGVSTDPPENETGELPPVQKLEDDEEQEASEENIRSTISDPFSDDTSVNHIRPAENAAPPEETAPSDSASAQTETSAPPPSE